MRAWSEEQDRERLVGETRNLRGAVEHLSSTLEHSERLAAAQAVSLVEAEAELDRLRSAIEAVLARRWHRITRGLRDLRHL